MIHSKAIDILKTFTKEELKQFSDFVRSPFFNKNKNLIKLYDALVKYHPEYEVENEKIFSKVYPGKSYSHNNFKKLLSEFLEIETTFLIQIRINTNEIGNIILLNKELDERRLDNIFLVNVSRLDGRAKDLKYADFNFNQKASLENQLIQFNIYRNQQQKNYEYLFKRSEYNLCYFLDHLFYDYYDLSILRSEYNYDSKLSVAELFLNNFDFSAFVIQLRESGIENFFIELKYNFLMMIVYPEDESYYLKAKKIILDNFDYFCDEKQKYILAYLSVLQAYCINKVEAGNVKYHREQFDLCKLNAAAVKKHYINSFIFFPLQFLFHIKFGVKYDKEWTENFINTFIKNVPDADLENIFHASFALLEFEKGNYEKSLEHSSKYISKTSEEVTKSQFKIISFKCYYELELYEQAISLIDTFKHYLKRSTYLNDAYKKKYFEIISFCKELLNLRLNYDTKNDELIFILIDKIRASRSLIDSDWFLKRLEDIERLKSEKQYIQKRRSKYVK